MDFKEWKFFYDKIIQELDIDSYNDQKSAEILDDLIRHHDNLVSIEKLEKMFRDKSVVVFGAGPSLNKSIEIHREKIDNMVKIAADGATSALVENNIIPEVIVTDLDGKIIDQINSNKKKAIVVIHAHGDNIEEIKKYVPKFKGDILGTTQINPKPYSFLHNFGGFTDGDRSIFLADHFQAGNIYLAGFDFNNQIGKYSFSENKDIKVKIRKLRWCKHLINHLEKTREIYYLKA